MKKLLFILLISNSLCAQNNKDTTRTYTHTELIKIATKLAKGEHCDSMLTYAKVQRGLDSLKLISKDKEIHNLNRVGVQNDSIQLGLNNKIKEYKTKETDTKNKTDFLKVGWVVTAVAVLVENVWLALRRD